jgi:hypothetical protein
VQYETGSGAFAAALVTFDGTWHAKTIPPLKGSPGGALFFVMACPAAEVCYGTSTTTNASGAQVPVALVLNHKLLATVAVPLPAGTTLDSFSGRGSVSCESVHACVGWGMVIDQGAQSAPLLLVFDNGVLSSRVGPLPSGGTQVIFTALRQIVSCAPGEVCEAVGSFIHAGQVGLFERITY